MPFFGVPIRNGLPIGLGSVAGFGVQQFDPSQLFEGGTVAGAWYDPSDLSTMFTTSAGTTPVAMPGQGAPVPVGLMLDKSQNGVGTNGAKRVNLLTFSEQFDNAAWTKSEFNAFGAGSVANTTATLDPLGGNTADYIQENATTNAHQVYSLGGIAVGAGSYRGFIYAKAAERSRLVMGIWNNTNYELCQFDLTNGVILQEATPGIAFIENAGNGWWKCGVSRTIGATTTYLSFGPYINANISTLTGPWTNAAYTGTGTSGIYIWGADLRLASEANTQPTYQRIDANWYSTMAGNHAIAFNNTTARPELRARVNLLTYSEEFDNGAWTNLVGLTGATPTRTANAGTDPLGGTTADRLQFSRTLSGFAQRSAIMSGDATFVFGIQYTASFYAKSYSGSNQEINLAINANGGVLQTFTVTSSWQRFTYTFTSGATLTVSGNAFRIGLIDAGSSALTSDVLLWGADLRPANIGANVPAYQRIADANTYDTSGFPLYLRFDGIDDSMYTPASIPFATVTSDGQARRNLLLNPTQFDDAAWTKTQSAVIANQTTAPDGASTADKLRDDLTPSGTHFLAQSQTTQAAAYTFSVYAKKSERDHVMLYHVQSNVGAIFSLDTGNVTTPTGIPLATATATDVGNGWWRCSINLTATAASNTFRIYLASNSTTFSYNGDGTSGIYIWGAQLETGSTATAFQNIGTDKVAVFAGVRKLSDAAVSVAAELSATSATNNGSWLVLCDTTPRYVTRSRGTSNSDLNGTSAFPAPITSVVTFLAEIATDTNILRVNGTQNASSTVDQGTGNYGTYPLYIGARNNSSLWFNGHLHSLIIAGSAVSAGNISATEQWVAGRTGIQI